MPPGRTSRAWWTRASGNNSCRPSARRGPGLEIQGPQCAFEMSMFMCPAVHMSTRNLLRSSSTHEPSDPPFRVVKSISVSRRTRQHRIWNKITGRIPTRRERKPDRRQRAEHGRANQRVFKPRTRCPVGSAASTPHSEIVQNIAGLKRPTSRTAHARVCCLVGRHRPGPQQIGRERTGRQVPTAGSSRLTTVFEDTITVKLDNDPSAGSPTETLLRLLLPLNDQVWASSRWNREGGPPRPPVRRPH